MLQRSNTVVGMVLSLLLVSLIPLHVTVVVVAVRGDSHYIRDVNASNNICSKAAKVRYRQVQADTVKYL
jgi:hypothetical protein